MTLEQLINETASWVNQLNNSFLVFLSLPITAYMIMSVYILAVWFITWVIAMFFYIPVRDFFQAVNRVVFMNQEIYMNVIGEALKEVVKIFSGAFLPLLLILCGLGVGSTLTRWLIKFVPAPPPPAPAEWTDYPDDDEEEEDEGYTPPRKPHPGRYRFLGIKR